MKKATKTLLIVLTLFTTLMCSKSVFAATGTWHQDSKGWWFSYTNGGYPSSKWETIKGKWYYFDGNGYIKTNQWIEGTYYVGSDGAMLVSSVTPDGYYVGSDGKYLPKGWVKSGSHWLYRYANGRYAKNKWESISGNWYYFDLNGFMVTNQWVEGYYLGSSGAMIKNASQKVINVDKNVDVTLAHNGCWGNAKFNIKGYYLLTNINGKVTINNINLNTIMLDHTIDWRVEMNSPSYTQDGSKVKVIIRYNFTPSYFDCPIGAPQYNATVIHV